MRSTLKITPGQYAKFRGTWGRVVLANRTVVFLEDWRGQLLTTAHIEEVTEVKDDERRTEDPSQRVYRRFSDFTR